MDAPENKCASASRAPWFVAAVLLVAVGVAVWAYPQLKMRRVVERLRDPSQRFQAKQQLLDLGEESVPYLIEVAEEVGHPAREDAIEALGRLEDPRALPVIMAVDDPELAEIRLHALGALRGPEALAEVLRHLEGDSVRLELAALVVLRQWPDVDAETVPRLTPYLDHHIAGARALACEGLGHRKHAESEPRITELLFDGSETPRVREAAAWALLQIGTQTARDAVDRAYEQGLVTLEDA
jgi:HEAT repeat protein